MPKETPPADIAISHDLIHALLQEFKPELADEPLEFVASGWDNEIHRIGNDHAIRLPRREAAATLITHEQRWLPDLAEQLPLPVPVPVHSGEPAFGFHWHWNVVPWLPGVPLAHSPALDTDQLLEDVSEFLNALHTPAPDDAPTNPSRGVPLAERSDAFSEHVDLLDPADASRASELWEELVDTPPWGGDPIWLHGDLHGLNLLVRGGRISAVIDFGDLCAGDPACDLAVAWMLFDNQTDRDRFRKASTIDDKTIGVHTWRRARAWALAISTAMLAHSASDATLLRIGRDAFERTLVAQ